VRGIKVNSSEGFGTQKQELEKEGRGIVMLWRRGGKERERGIIASWALVFLPTRLVGLGLPTLREICQANFRNI